MSKFNKEEIMSISEHLEKSAGKNDQLAAGYLREMINTINRLEIQLKSQRQVIDENIDLISRLRSMLKDIQNGDCSAS